MCKAFELVYDRKTGTWEEKKEPFAIIEIDTESDYKFFVERAEKQIAKKPLGVDLHGKANGNIHKWICPTCITFLSNRRKVTEAHNNFIPSYCPVCGQKIDWSIKNDCYDIQTR